MKNYTLTPLTTPFEEELNKSDIPFCEYPRPQFKRDSYICLNGEWDFAIKDKSEKPLGKINVPFAPQSRISGIGQDINHGATLIYSRNFILPDGFKKDRVILHFGACDQYTTVYVNDKEAGKNVGGYLPFSFDITEFLNDTENALRVEVTDPLDINLPYGKQTKKRGGMWYTPISGIWQTVWLESIPKNHIKDLRITPTLDSVTIEVKSTSSFKTLTLHLPSGPKKYNFTNDSITIKIPEPINWTPENPYLYHFTLSSGGDEVDSYFALRTITVEDTEDGKRLCLNGKPYFFHGLLDQGYYSDGIFLPATPKGFEYDILQMKNCGFNTLRKHIKMEPELFYYYCDKYGMIVFQDFINSGRYGFIIDTALPTLFLRKGVTHRATRRRKEAFFDCSEGIINTLYNHPCVCYYTIFNEGWGQFEADSCYKHFKSLDPTRIYDTTSGWFKEELSDVESEHIYFKPLTKFKFNGKRPLVISEFGGFSCIIKDHVANKQKNYGYSTYKEKEDFEEALLKLYRNEVIPLIKSKGLCATVLTQVSDIEDETNGLLTYDRQVLKVDAKKMKALADEILNAYDKAKK